MMKVVYMFFLIPFFVYSQEKKIELFSVPQELKENSNSVILRKSVEVVLASSKKMTIKTDKLLVVFNDNGLEDLGIMEYYTKSDRVKSMVVALYDKSGSLIKVFNQKDLKDYSTSQGYDISDGRVVFLDYKVANFPLTVHYQSEVERSNTAFISSWNPIENLSQAVVSSSYTVSSEPSLGLKSLETNFEGYGISKKEFNGGVSYFVENIPAVLYESYSPYLDEFLPKVAFSIEKFNLENYAGVAQNWEQFSAWNYNNFIEGTDDLSLETQEKIKSLVKDVTEPVEKAKLIYKYMQDKTRYISVHLGIGGWKPMLAKDVDRLGYGDCKALTNYTRALLKVVGIESYYSVVYGGSGLRDIRSDLIAMQGNHIILALPNKGEMIWLECTSQTTPFGYIANFTDDRKVLLIAPEKGRLIRTKRYELEENTQVKTAVIQLNQTGGIAVNLQIQSKGNQFGNSYQLMQKSKLDLEKYYKDYFFNINSMKVIGTNLKVDLNEQSCVEELKFTASSYANVFGNQIIFVPNVVNGIRTNLSKGKNRKAPFKISRSYFDTDEVTIQIPEGFEVEFLPVNVKLVSEYGEYHLEFSKTDANSLKYKRVLKLFSGSYPKENYESFRTFRLAVASNDGTKIVLKKT